MPWLAPLASGLLSRRAVNRAARLIPNPALRYVAVIAATTIVPYLAAKAAAKWQNDHHREENPFPKSRR